MLEGGVLCLDSRACLLAMRLPDAEGLEVRLFDVANTKFSLIYFMRGLLCIPSNYKRFLYLYSTPLRDYFFSEFKIPRKRMLFLICLIGSVSRFRPSAFLSWTDDSKVVQALDCIFSADHPFLTIQNGKRWYGASSRVLDSAHIISPSFHSNISFLSQYEAQKSIESGARILRYSVGGSYLAKYFSADAEGFETDVCIIENSPTDRQSNHLLVEYVNQAVKLLGSQVRFSVLLKRSKSDAEFLEYYDYLRRRYHEDVELIPRQADRSSISHCLKARVVVGVLSTLLNEALGSGCKILPLNFEGPKFDGEFPIMGEVLNPSLSIFIRRLSRLLDSVPQEYDAEFARQIRYIGMECDASHKRYVEAWFESVKRGAAN